MTEEERQAMETLAAEANRLRSDPSFAAAVLELKKGAVERLSEANQALVDAVLANGDTGESQKAVIQQRATIEAIDGLTTEIANQILRGKSRIMTGVA